MGERGREETGAQSGPPAGSEEPEGFSAGCCSRFWGGCSVSGRGQAVLTRSGAGSACHPSAARLRPQDPRVPRYSPRPSLAVLPPDESTLLAVLPLPADPGGLFPSRRAAAAPAPRGGTRAPARLPRSLGRSPRSLLVAKSQAEAKRGAEHPARHRPGAAGLWHVERGLAGAAGQAGGSRTAAGLGREARGHPGEPGRGAQRLQQEERRLHLPIREVRVRV